MKGIYTVEGLATYKALKDTLAVFTAKNLAGKKGHPVKVYLDGNVCKLIDASGHDLRGDVSQFNEPELTPIEKLAVIRQKYNDVFNAAHSANYHNHKRIAIRG